MSVLNLEEHRKVNPNAEDLMIRGNPPHPLFSLRVQEGDKHLQCKRWYICVKGMGMSIETMEPLTPGKWLAEHIEEMLDGKMYIESSVRTPFEMSPALLVKVGMANTYKVERDVDGLWELLVETPRDGNVILKTFPEEVPMRCLEAILHFHEFGEVLPVPFEDLSKDARQELARSLREELKCGDWPAPGEYLTIDYDGGKVSISHQCHINLINANFFYVGEE